MSLNNIPDGLRLKRVLDTNFYDGKIKKHEYDLLIGDLRYIMCLDEIGYRLCSIPLWSLAESMATLSFDYTLEDISKQMPTLVYLFDAFICDKCGRTCVNSPLGYISGCEHYPLDMQRLPADMEDILHDNLWSLYIKDDNTEIIGNEHNK